MNTPAGVVIPKRRWFVASSTARAQNIALDPVDLISAGIDKDGQVGQYAVHAYTRSRCTPETAQLATIPGLLDMDFVRAYIRSRIVTSTATLASGAGGTKRWVLGEGNSISCGGVQGVSDAMASTLHMVAWGLSYAAYGASQVFLHGGGSVVRRGPDNKSTSNPKVPQTPSYACYSFAYPTTEVARGEQRAQPGYVGQLLLAEAIGSGGVSRVVLIPTPQGVIGSNFFAAAIYDDSIPGGTGPARIVLMNGKPRYNTSTEPAGSMTFDFSSITHPKPIETSTTSKTTKKTSTRSSTSSATRTSSATDGTPSVSTSTASSTSTSSSTSAGLSTTRVNNVSTTTSSTTKRTSSTQTSSSKSTTSHTKPHTTTTRTSSQRTTSSTSSRPTMTKTTSKKTTSSSRASSTSRKASTTSHKTTSKSKTKMSTVSRSTSKLLIGHTSKSSTVNKSKATSTRKGTSKAATSTKARPTPPPPKSGNVAAAAALSETTATESTTRTETSAAAPTASAVAYPVKRLTGSSIDTLDTAQILWAGQSFKYASAVGEKVVEVLTNSTITVRDSEAVIIYLRGQPF